MPQDDGSAITTWECCATVDETRRLVNVAQRIGVAVELTSVRLDPDGPHGQCDEQLIHEEGVNIDGYVVQISCDAPHETTTKLHEEIKSLIHGCLVLRR